MTEQTVTVNIHHPQVLRAQNIGGDRVSVTLSNGGYPGQVSLIFKDESEAVLFGQAVIEVIAGLEK